jgi:hypothetical protein
MRSALLVPVAVFGCLAAWICANLSALGLWSPLPEAAHSSVDCNFISGIRGAEDITRIADRLYIASSDARLDLFEIHSKGPLRTENGSLYSIAVQKGSAAPVLTKLQLQGFPLNTAFHPHGVYYLPAPSSLLAVVNHAHGAGTCSELTADICLEATASRLPTSYTNASFWLCTCCYVHHNVTGGERIDLFSVSVQKGVVALTYKSTVSPANLASSHAMLNDVVLISPDELYVTQVTCQPCSIQFMHVDSYCFCKGVL